MPFDLEADLQLATNVDTSFQTHLDFIKAAYERWPETIRYAMKLEEENDRLRNELNILQEQLGERGVKFDCR